MEAESVENSQVGQSSYTIISYPSKDLPEAYKGLVFSKWLRSLRYSNDYFRLIDSESYFRVYHEYIERLLSNPSTIVRLAVLTDDFDVVFGFSVARGDVLHYCHTHKDSRKQIGRAHV